MSTTPTTTTQKLREAAWRYWPERTEKIAGTIAITAAGIAAAAAWVWRGRN